MAHRERRRLRRSHLSPSRPILVRVERLPRGSNLLREGYVFLWGRHRERDCDYVPGGGAQTIRPHRRANGRSFPARPVLDVVGLIEAAPCSLQKAYDSNMADTQSVAQVLGSWRCSIALLRAMSSDGSLLF